MESICFYRSPLGMILMAGRENCLTGLWFQGQKHFPSHMDGITREKLSVFSDTAQWLDRYFQGADPGPRPPLSPRGTPFQQQVWRLLCQIPYGRLVTYGQLAAALAQERQQVFSSARAVGGAVGRNPISILIPCHRVVGKDGSLTGYAGGLPRKQYLLRLEKASLSFHPDLNLSEPADF